MAKHVEMIIDYIVTDAPDYEYNDNHGMLIRCKDCKHRQRGNIENEHWCMMLGKIISMDFYCGFAKKRDD